MYIHNMAIEIKYKYYYVWFNIINKIVQINGVGTPIIRLVIHAGPICVYFVEHKEYGTSVPDVTNR